MSSITIFHNPACGTSRNTLALIRHAGLDFIGEHPVLMNRPVVVTPLGVKLCRPSEAVLELLPVGKLQPFTKEDGEVVTDDGVRRA